MGALVTLELAGDSPLHELPWIITFGPIDDEEEWEPAVCGPYERAHALGLAEAVVADEDLMAVVEPLLPRVSVEEIRRDIAEARLAVDTYDASAPATADPATTISSSGQASPKGQAGPEGQVGPGSQVGSERQAGGTGQPDPVGQGSPGGQAGSVSQAAGPGTRAEPGVPADAEVSGPPSPTEVRAGFARIAARLTTLP